MLRTGIPVTQLDREDDAVIITMVQILNADDAEQEAAQGGYIDPDDPSTIPAGWL